MTNQSIILFIVNETISFRHLDFSLFMHSTNQCLYRPKLLFLPYICLNLQIMLSWLYAYNCWKGQACTEKACATCPKITSTWTKCFSDYQMTGAGKLVACNNPNCLQCPNFTSTCTVCNPGYFLTSIGIAKKTIEIHDSFIKQLNLIFLSKQSFLLS